MWFLLEGRALAADPVYGGAMNFVIGAVVGINSVIAAAAFGPLLLDKLLGRPDPNPKDSNGDYIN